ncbi:MAG: response regulator [Deltaproteobacteria bacterium]|nr:response regulator [Deltaproteobacteria bacterium]
MRETPIKILLVEDDEDDQILFQNILHEIPNYRFDVGVASSYDQAVQRLSNNPYDLMFIDFFLGEKNGLDLLQEMNEMGLAIPAIMLTGKGNPDIDVQAMRGGAADYLEKGTLDSCLLERTVRYALERNRTLLLLKERKNELKKLSKKLLSVQEKERQHIARELHDSIGGTLTAVKYALEEKLYFQNNGSPSQGTPLEEIISWVKKALNETRTICTDLRPDVLDDLGLLAAIQTLFRRCQQVCEGLEITGEMSVAEEDVPQELRIAVYRILQEALNNVAKHSEATHVAVRLTENGDGLELFIQDNGNGFEVPDPAREQRRNEGMGLGSMRDRTELFSGQFALHSQPRQGTTIRCFWPHA